MLRPLPAFAAFVSTLCLIGCLFNTSEENTPATPKGSVIYIASYTMQGDRLVTPERKKEHVSCDDSALTRDTVTEEATVTKYTITGSRLELISEPDSTRPIPEPQLRVFAVRQGRGSGLRGIWQVDSMMEIASASASSMEREFVDSTNARMRRKLATGDAYYFFSGDTLKLYEDRDYARDFVDDWNTAPSLGHQSEAEWHDISVKEVDRDTVELIGRENGETVRIALMAGAGRTYESDLPAHPKYIFLPEPVSCPNEEQPDWYIDFLNANAKSDSSSPGLATAFPRNLAIP